MIGVGYGLRERGGQVTREIAFRVYVREKLPRPLAQACSRLSRLLTKAFRLTYSGKTAFGFKGAKTTPNMTPWRAGINIPPTRRRPTAQGGGDARLLRDDRLEANRPRTSSSSRTITLSGRQRASGQLCLSAALDADNTNIFKPVPLDDAEAAALHAPPGTKTAGSPIGKIWALPTRDDHPYHLSRRGARQLFIDCAAVRLAICISSLCHTNCSGFDFSRKIPGLHSTSHR